MSSELHELAARGRATRDARSNKRKRRRPATRPPKRKLSKVLKQSLRPKSFYLWMVAIFVVAVIPAVLSVKLAHTSVWYELLLLLAAAAIALGGVFLLMHRSVQSQIVWAYGVGYGLNGDEYIQALDCELGDHGQMTVRVEFQSPIPEPARQTVADAAIGASKADSASFDGDTLVVRSPVVKTYFRSRSESGTHTYYSNRLLHQWFRSLVIDGLDTIHDSYLIEKLSVRTQRS